jgi:hypothetical protein
MDLKIIAQEIREILQKRRDNLDLTFEEELHKYSMRDTKGVIKGDWPSVSKVLKSFYQEFPTDDAAEKKSKGDPVLKEKLIKEWAEAGTYSTNMGSRVHFMLEKKSLELFDYMKLIRQPIFECDFTQILKSDSMIHAGTNFLNLMKERGAVLLDTEIVLGDPELGYTGQGDTAWLIKNKTNDDWGFIITDYKTNKKKNFEENQFTKRMYYPFTNQPNNALGHYFVQLPLYGKLLLKMLKGTKFEDKKLYGCIIVHLKDDSQFEEYRVPKEVVGTVLDMDVKKYLTSKK